MNDVFKEYSLYYDLLYKDKNYEKESEYIHQLISEFSGKKCSKTILNLGCGTGQHDIFLSKFDYQIDGVDFSSNMLEMANENLNKFPDLQKKIRYLKGDVRSVFTNKSYGIVLSLFHVMSYQINNEDFISSLNTVKKHLKPGGIFIFDCWFGPAVLTIKPSVKVFENNQYKITRIAIPETYPTKNLVDVNYNIFIKNKEDDLIYELNETHTMRYFFNNEIELLLSMSGFKILFSEEWLTKEPLGLNTWSATYVCKLIKK